jgi:hypothetical protein
VWASVLPFGAIAWIRSVQGITGAAAARLSGVPAGLRQGTSRPSGSITRSRRAASANDWPPPYESPVTPMRAGSATPSSTRRPTSSCVSRTS